MKFPNCIYGNAHYITLTSFYVLGFIAHKKDTYCADHNPWKGAGTSLEECFSYCEQFGLSWPLVLTTNMNCACCDEPPTLTTKSRYDVYQIQFGKI